MIIDKDGKGTEEGQPDNKGGEGGNGTKIETNPEDNNPINQPGGEADPNGGTTPGEDGENDKGKEAPTGKEEEGAEPTPPVDVDKIVDQILAKTGLGKEKEPEKEKLDPKEAAARIESIAKKLGITPEAVRYFTNQNMQVADIIRKEVSSKLAVINKSSALARLSREKGFEDANRHAKGVDEFLSVFDESEHSDPELLRRAVIYSRGLEAQKNLKQVQNTNERNKKIAGTGRPASPGEPKDNKVVVLTPLEKETARAFGMSEKQYSEIKKNGKFIADKVA